MHMSAKEFTWTEVLATAFEFIKKRISSGTSRFWSNYFEGTCGGCEKGYENTVRMVPH